MKASDLKTVLEIETRVYQFPWSERTFRDCLRVGYCCWVYEHAGLLVAYGILSVGAGESHVLNVVVMPELQQRGHGRRMMDKLIELAREHRADTIFLEVRPSNTAAIALYEKMGFNEIGTRADYYPTENGREDALVFGLTLTAPGADGERADEALGAGEAAGTE